MSAKRETQQRIEKSAAEIRTESFSDEESREIAGRVWKRLEARSGQAPTEAEVGTIRGCEDYQSLIQPYLAGELAPARALLVEEHTRHCLLCRKALKAAQSGESMTAASVAVSSRGGGGLRWAAAILLAVAAGWTGYQVWYAGPDLPHGAIVEASGAGLFRTASQEPLSEGAVIAVGESVRSAPGENAVLRLADGSRLEVRGRSQLSVESQRRGATVRIARGDVIVEAAPQTNGRLYVSTDDALVSVKGTIFAVSHGTKGSRVAVIEGEVQVDHSGREEVLYAGDRTATYAVFAHTDLADELSWSNDTDRYLALLGEITELRQALARDLPRPELRYSSRLLGLAPDDMALYAAFPNLGGTVAEAHRIVTEQIAASPLLSEWWANQTANHGDGDFDFEAHVEEATTLLSEAGSYLGAEIVVFAGSGDTGDAGEGQELGMPVVLAEVVDAAGLRAFLLEQASAHGHDSTNLPFFFLDEAGAEAISEVTGEHRLAIWLGEDTMIASPNADLVSGLAAGLGGNATPPGDFKARLAEIYSSGAEILVAADLHRVMDMAHGVRGDEGDAGMAEAEKLGLFDARHVILQQKHVGDRTQSDAVVTFDGPRRGVAGWLGEPAPMGSLSYISPDAKLAGVLVTESPARIFNEILALDANDDPETSAEAELEKAEEKLGINVRDDIAASLGGEVAFAFDGALVPKPAWKLVVEVYDPDRLLWALGKLLEAGNEARAEEGLPAAELTTDEVNGRTYYGVSAIEEGEHEIWLTFDEGYLLVAPERASIDRAIRFRQSGYSLDSSAKFTKLLPADGQQNFSALLYQDALSLLAPLTERISSDSLSEEQLEAIQALQSNAEPTLAYAYGEESRIVFAAAGAMDLLTAGLPGLLGFGQMMEMHPPVPPSDSEAAPATAPAANADEA